MKKILYIASLATKKDRYDGERIKSSYIFECLKEKYSDVSVINLSLNKVFETLKLIFYSIFLKKKFDHFIISKDPRGASIIEKIFYIFKVPQEKIYYFEIGPFLYDFSITGRINKKYFLNNKKIIVETKGMKTDLESLGFKNVDVFPNFKRKPKLKIEEKIYPKDTLSLVFLSRIEHEKGIYDIIQALKMVNKGKTNYLLDVYGMFTNDEEKKEFFNEIRDLPYIKYCGQLDMLQDKGYEKIKNYDLHIFPTHYGEGFPGSLIDFFFLSIPTVSSSFARVWDILSNDDSFIYKQGSISELSETLFNIYENQKDILKKANHLKEKQNLYTLEKFELFLENMLNEK